MVELKGTLGGTGLPAIVQLLAELRETGRLRLSNAHGAAELSFEDGALVGATFGDVHGLSALDATVLTLTEGEFAFVGGGLPAEHNVELTAAELRVRMAELAEPRAPVAPPEPPSPPVAAPELLGACPRLGFADDPSRHYSRPTALHRCFASGRPGLVSSQEQRELCLGGRYAKCARFRAPAPLAADAPGEAVEPEPEPVISSRSEPPPGVAARLAVAAQMGAGPPRPETTVTTPVAMREDWRKRIERWPLLIATGALVGLLLVGWTVGILPMLRRSPTQTAAIPSPGLVPAFAASPAPTSSLQPRAIPSQTALARPATSVTLPKPTARVAEARGQTLMDTRFAGEAQADWIDNAPFALWRDGAYRLAAREPTRFVAVAAPVEPLEKVLVSATLRKTGGPPGGGYGLIVRDQGPEPRDGANQEMQAYVLEAGDLGEYGVWRREADRWVDLVPWTHSAAVRSGGSPNELTVRVDGSGMMFSINGVDVATVDDTELPVGGKVGVFVGGDFNEVALDRFLVLIPD
jgi:Domain of unknown function (DUF4388)